MFDYLTLKQDFIICVSKLNYSCNIPLKVNQNFI